MILLRTASLLVVSNIFMTFAWYAHLRNLSDRKWFIAVVVSWGIDHHTALISGYFQNAHIT